MFPTILLVDCRYTYASMETSADGGSHCLEWNRKLARRGGCGDGAAAGRSETLGRGGAGARVRGGGARGQRRDRSRRPPDGVGEEESAQQATPVCGLDYIGGMICRGGS